MHLLRRVTDKMDFPIVTAEDVQIAKPARNLSEVAAHKLEGAPNDCFIESDSAWDVLAGRGMNASIDISVDILGKAAAAEIPPSAVEREAAGQGTVVTS
jgi:beta-phosphoglucomutase-like phosphatase (HAD superfamily)